MMHIGRDIRGEWGVGVGGVKWEEQHYQAEWRRSGRRLGGEGPALGSPPQTTGPPWQPDVLQNKYCYGGASPGVGQLVEYELSHFSFSALWVWIWILLPGPKTRHSCSRGLLDSECYPTDCRLDRGQRRYEEKLTWLTEYWHCHFKIQHHMHFSLNKYKDILRK